MPRRRFRSSRRVSRVYGRGALNKRRKLWSVRVPRNPGTLMPTKLTITLPLFSKGFHTKVVGATHNGNNATYFDHFIEAKGIDPLENIKKNVADPPFNTTVAYSDANLVGFDRFKALYSKVYVSHSSVSVKVKGVSCDKGGAITPPQLRGFVLMLVPATDSATPTFPTDEPGVWKALQDPQGVDNSAVPARIKCKYVFGRWHAGYQLNVPGVLDIWRNNSPKTIRGNMKTKTIFPAKTTAYETLVYDPTTNNPTDYVKWHLRVMTTAGGQPDVAATGGLFLTDQEYTYEITTKLKVTMHFSDAISATQAYTDNS